MAVQPVPYSPVSQPRPDREDTAARGKDAGKRTGSAGAALAQFCLGAVAGALIVTAALGAVCAAYIVKSAMGIDLFPGPSPLHDPLFEVARALRGWIG